MFNLSYIILDRDDLQSVDAFGAAILDDENNDLDEVSHDLDAHLGNVRFRSIAWITLLTELQSSLLTSRFSAVDVRTPSSSLLERAKLDTRKVVNVVIAKGFNFAHEDVQIQALEVRRFPTGICELC